MFALKTITFTLFIDIVSAGIPVFMIGFISSVKSYCSAIYILAKPAMIYSFMKGLWLSGIAGAEWFAGRLYSKNCIGEGFNGFYNHIWTIASPSCTGLLTTHVSLLGIFIASFAATFIWLILMMVNKLKEDNKNIMNEWNKIKNN